MNLPVLGSRPEAGVAALRRADRALAALLAEAHAMEHGTQYSSAACPHLGECNFLDDTPIEELNALPGYRRVDLMAWSGASSHTTSEGGAIRVVPGRGLRRDFLALQDAAARERTGEPRIVEQYTALFDARLDSPQYEPLVARVDRSPVGAAALFTTGDVARMCDLYVPPLHRRGGVGRELLRTALALAARWGVATVVTRCREDNLAAGTLFERAGLRRAGTIALLVRDGAQEPAE
jgi:GNAT superfamily N-acetyltransferase